MNHRSLLAFCIVALLPASACLAQGEAAPAAPAPIEIKGGPVDQSLAAAFLTDSPRHAEWVDVPPPADPSAGVPAPAPIKTWIVYPERADKAPVVIVIHEIFGMTDWVRATADQLAADGFIAVAPDLLSGMGPDGGATDSMTTDKVRETIRTLTPEAVASRLNRVRDYALKLPAASAKSACIGFCWGGSQSFRYAAAQPGLQGAIVFYGTAPMKDNQPDTEVLSRIQCPVLGLYGGNDARVTTTVPATDQAMRTLSKSFEHHEYAGAGHGFVRQQLGTNGANIDAAKEAWSRTVGFLKKHLE